MVTPELFYGESNILIDILRWLVPFRADENSRGGKAVRLTYDHKGSDTQEAKRIMDAGGFVMNNRVNGECAALWTMDQGC